MYETYREREREPEIKRARLYGYVEMSVRVNSSVVSRCSFCAQVNGRWCQDFVGRREQTLNAIVQNASRAVQVSDSSVEVLSAARNIFQVVEVSSNLRTLKQKQTQLSNIEGTVLNLLSSDRLELVS